MGCSTPQSSEFGKVVIHLAKGETESITYGIFGEKLRIEELWLNNCIRSEKIWWRGGRSTRM